MTLPHILYIEDVRGLYAVDYATAFYHGLILSPRGRPAT
jgi:hypothetical protein